MLHGRQCPERKGREVRCGQACWTGNRATSAHQAPLVSALTLLLRPGFLETAEQPILWGQQPAGVYCLKKVKYPFTKDSEMLFYSSFIGKEYFKIYIRTHGSGT